MSGISPGGGRRIVHNVASGFIIFIGLIHIGFTPASYARLGAPALWFAGSGAFLIAAGSLNLAFVRAHGRDILVKGLSLLIDLTGAAFAIWAISAVGGPPPYALLLLFATAAVLVILDPRASSTAPGQHDR